MAERTPARARAKVTAVARPRTVSTPALAKENDGTARNQGTPITKRPSESPPPESRASPRFGDREDATPPLTRSRPALGGSNTQSWPSLPRAQPGGVAPPPPAMPPAQLGDTRPPSKDGSDAGGGRRVVRAGSASAVRPVVRPSSGKVTGVRRAAATTPAWASSEDARERDALEASEKQAREAQEAREREAQEARLAERERQMKDRARELELREEEAREREARGEREEQEAREREERRAREEQEAAERGAHEVREAADRRAPEELLRELEERRVREELEARDRETREREAREQEERARLERERKAREHEAREREARQQAEEEEARVQALSKGEQARIREKEALEHMARIKAKKDEEERIVREAREKALERKRLQEEREAKEREAEEKRKEEERQRIEAAKEEERQRIEAAKQEVIEARARAARELAKPDRTSIQFDETTPLEELLTLLQSAQFQITDMHAEIQNLKNSVLQAAKAQSEKAIIFQNEKEEMAAKIATLEEETKALKQENASLSSRKVGWGDEAGDDDSRSSRSMAGSKGILELAIRPDTTASWGSRPYTATSLASFASASSHASLVYSASPNSMRSVAEWIFPLQTRSLPPDKPYDRVLLPPNDPRREWLEGYVKGSLMHHRKSYDSDDWCPPPEVEIIRVSEVLNPTSSNAYGQQLAQMQEIWTTDRESVPELVRAIPIRTSWNGPRMNEVLLFHGCKWDAVFGILREGFDTRLGGTGTGAAFGIGSYFTTVASKADGYTERWEDWEHHPDVEVPPELRCMLVARVALGEIHEMEEADASLRRPPPGPNNVRCDSVLGVPRDRGGCVDYDEFVIYKPAQATPQFIVDYQHISSCQCRCCSRSKF